MMHKSITAALLITSLGMSTIFFSSSADASMYCETKKKIKQTSEVFKDYCEHDDLVNTTAPNPEAEPGDPDYSSWFFEIPADQECDIGLNFPDLGLDLDFGLGKLNVCNVLKKVSENAVSQVNEEFDKIEEGIDGFEDSANDLGNVDLDDLADEVEYELNGGN